MKTILPISVIIPTMNRPETLMRTIYNIIQNEQVPAQIIVVDQSDNEIKRKKNQEHLETYSNLIETNYIYQELPSLTAARNRGLTACKNEIVVCSDDDVDVNCNTFINVFHLMQDNNVSMIAGIDETMGNSATKLGYIFCKRSYKNRNIGHVTLSMLGRFPDNVEGEIDTQWAMGYFFAVKKSLIHKWGIRWDEKLTGYAYPEDLDFSFTFYKKAIADNLRCILSDKVKVKHLVSREYRVPSYKSTFMYVVNREYLSYKHKLGLRSRLATRWTNFGEFLYRLLNNEKPGDMLRAQWYCDMHRREIKNGIINS